jgi:hypothetical protein
MNKHVAGVGIFAIAFGATYSLVGDKPSAQFRSASPRTSPKLAGTAETNRGEAPTRAVASSAGEAPTSPPDSGASATDGVKLADLRTRVIAETGLAMQRKQISVMDCLTGVDIAVDQRIRFVVHVSSTPTEAVVSRWRFDQIVDGQELPASFSSCAEKVLGGEMRVAADAYRPFPFYDGDISTIYRIPGPR